MHSPLLALMAIACATPLALAAQQSSDTAYHNMQMRGAMTMGVDQETSSHGFQSLPDGGRITFIRKVDDTAGVRLIRAHLLDMQRAFGSGDFSMPMSIHMKTVPGVKDMVARRARITYTETDVPNGGELRIKTSDPVAIAAVHRFLAFQRQEHRAGSTPEHGPVLNTGVPPSP
jgi:hypothetical protein